MSTGTISNETLAADLGQFIGTQDYHRWSGLFRQHLLTDGAHYLAEQVGAYWLMDAIASYLPRYRGEEFVVATLARCKTSTSWTLTIDDGNGRKLAQQRIEYSDFPLPEIKLFVQLSEFGWVIMLPSEY